MAKASAIPQSLIEISGAADLRASRVRCSAQDSGSGLARHEKSIGAAEIELVDPVQQVRHRHDDNAGVSPLLGGGSIAASLKREAAPVATTILSNCDNDVLDVSISNEKPPQLPPPHPVSVVYLPVSFNLKREAAPVATTPLSLYGMQNTAFQSQTRSRPSCHAESKRVPRTSLLGFQSQTRSRPSCHPFLRTPDDPCLAVSISNEKPPQLPQDLVADMVSILYVSISNEKPPQLPRGVRRKACPGSQSFNLKREAAPVATKGTDKHEKREKSGFNLKREAAPVATCQPTAIGKALHCCFNLKREAAPVATCSRHRYRYQRRVSISNEKPPQLPHDLAQQLAQQLEGFNLKREAAPVATCPQRQAYRR